MQQIKEKNYFLEKLLKDREINDLLNKQTSKEDKDFLENLNEIRKILHIKEKADKKIYEEYNRLIIIPTGSEETLVRELHQFNKAMYKSYPEHYTLDIPTPEGKQPFVVKKKPNKIEIPKNILNLSNPYKQESSLELTNTEQQLDNDIDLLKEIFNKNFYYANKNLNVALSNLDVVTGFLNSFINIKKIIEEKNILTINELLDQENYLQIKTTIKKFIYILKNNLDNTIILKKELNNTKKIFETINIKNIKEKTFYNNNKEILIANENNNEDNKIIIKKILQIISNYENSLIEDNSIENVNTNIERANTVLDNCYKVINFIESMQNKNFNNKVVENNKWSLWANDLDEKINEKKLQENILKDSNEIFVKDEEERISQLNEIKKELINGNYSKLKLSKTMNITCSKYMKKLEILKKGFEKTYGSELFKKIRDLVVREGTIYKNIDSNNEIKRLNNKKLKLKKAIIKKQKIKDWFSLK
ncbi:hypothetical protein SGLAD_v1c05090 [Spiroplasma gladiatoris]|uniref:Uncharacterized protein n=1 Tax=Spiroplasma gladiatoris TaxID=2143 RepID=A0A4P7AIW1_9MOLU|nr:hypothetical protein [Spiroplasma gladiatoris]QBQ07708.1 hypothetical protein SGLAD_v1c05090 [Spiroplasma gladiatoris]